MKTSSWTSKTIVTRGRCKLLNKTVVSHAHFDLLGPRARTRTVLVIGVGFRLYLLKIRSLQRVDTEWKTKKGEQDNTTPGGSCARPFATLVLRLSAAIALTTTTVYGG